jgi:hypothetical protein
VITLRRHPLELGFACGALAEAELAFAIEPQLQQRPLVELVHLDRVVRTGARAQRTAGAGVLLDHDLAAARVEGDRVEVARIDAARVGAGVARVDEVEPAEDAAGEREPLDAVARLARLLAGAALDARLEPAHAQRERDREAVSHRQIGDRR